MKEFDELLTLLHKLRGPDGCAWDKKQTIESFAPHLMAEAKEVEEAVAAQDWKGLQEELGDLLYNILQLSAIAEEQGHFDLAAVLNSVHEKITRRHPHVFDPKQRHLNDPETIERRWKEIKEEEKRK
ncbi:MAG TPA: MazG nucleotide pyrophosphohydrolase domain-containing protein [Candidatus Nanoarchaeia archaeon]|nr:MazG nucleotide pyrophosphohydrolase domain-containing protein [Candidatus Nanoarchaeia archaeon]